MTDLTPTEERDALAAINRQRRVRAVVDAACAHLAGTPLPEGVEGSVLRAVEALGLANRAAHVDLRASTPLDYRRADALLGDAEAILSALGAERQAQPDTRLSRGCPECGEALHQQERCRGVKNLPRLIERCHHCGFERPASLSDYEE